MKEEIAGAAFHATNQEDSGLVAHSVPIGVADATLTGDLDIPTGAGGLVIFAHGSGSSRLSPRNQFVARSLRDSGCGTLLFDLLTAAEETADAIDGRLRFDIDLLARRLVQVTEWADATLAGHQLPLGYFGASTGGAAALMAAAALGSKIRGVVSRGGRPDLAENALPRVRAATLLIVGGHDQTCLKLNKWAYSKLSCPKDLKVVPGATHLFEEPGALETVCQMTAEWFTERWRDSGNGRSCVSEVAPKIETLGRRRPNACNL